MSRNPWLTFALFAAICFSVAAVGSVWTSTSVRTWYVRLQKPSFNPPSWVFGPVWSVLYLSMAMSAWLVWRNAGWNTPRAAFILFFVQLGLNLAWSGLFFGLHQPGAGVRRHTRPAGGDRSYGHRVPPVFGGRVLAHDSVRHVGLVLPACSILKSGD